VGTVISWFVLRYLIPKKGGNYILLVPPEASGSDVAGFIYMLSMRYGILGYFNNINLTVADCGMCDSAAEMCDFICEGCDNIKVCSCEEIYDVILSEQLQKKRN
jgi:hypothetical protein